MPRTVKPVVNIGGELDSTALGDVHVNVTHTIYHHTLIDIQFLLKKEDVSKVNGLAKQAPVLEGELSFDIIVNDTKAASSDKFKFKVAGLGLGVEGPWARVHVVGTSFLRDWKYSCQRKVWVDTKIPDMISELAEAHGMTAEVESAEQEFTLHQCDRTDYEYLMNELRTRLFFGGSKRILMYDNGQKALVVKPIESAESSGLKVTQKDSHTDSRFGYSRAFSMMMTDEDDYGHTAEIRDITKLQMPYTEYVDQFFHDSTTGVSYLDGSAPPKAGPSGEIPASVKQILIEKVDEMTDFTNELFVRRNWEPRSRLVRTWVEGYFHPKIKVGETVDLSIETGDGTTLFPNGTNLIYAVHHYVGPAGEGTNLFLERRGI